MPGERPSHIPPENPFGSDQGKLPPEPTEKFVERYLGKKGARSAETAEPAAPDDLLTPEERTIDLAERDVVEGLKPLYIRERDKLREFFGRAVDVPPPPPDVTAERVDAWRELGFGVHYLPRTEVTGQEPKLKVPLKLDSVNKNRIERFGPDELTVTELPGAWVLIDERDKPDREHFYADKGTAHLIESLSFRFDKSWREIHGQRALAEVAGLLKVQPDQVRLPRAVEFNVLGNLYYPQWGTTDTWEWLEDSYIGGAFRLVGGNSEQGGLAAVDGFDPTLQERDVGFRPLVVLG